MSPNACVRKVYSRGWPGCERDERSSGMGEPAREVGELSARNVRGRKARTLERDERRPPHVCDALRPVQARSERVPAPARHVHDGRLAQCARAAARLRGEPVEELVDDAVAREGDEGVECGGVVRKAEGAGIRGGGGRAGVCAVRG